MINNSMCLGMHLVINILGPDLFLRCQEPRILNVGSPKNNKLAKDKANLKTTTPFSRNQRSILTQSVSFPAKGVRADVMNKSIDVYPLKREAKDAQRNGTKSHSNHPNRHASTGVHSKEANKIGGASGRPTSLASTPSIRRSVVKKISVQSFMSVNTFHLLPYFMLKFVLACISLGSLVL
jgi:hypothetical protein